jgi:hypothetical protein
MGGNNIAQEIANASNRTVEGANRPLNFDEETGEPFVRWYRFGGFDTVNPDN